MFWLEVSRLNFSSVNFSAHCLIFLLINNLSQQILSLHILHFITAHFTFITAQIGYHCTLKLGMDWIHNRQQAWGCTLYRHDNTVYFDFVLIPPAPCTYNNTTDLGRTVWLLLLSFKFPGDFKRDHSLQTQRMINIHVFHLAIVGNTFCIGYKQKRFKLKLNTVTDDSILCYWVFE
jgi:hypothetical protein